MGERTWDWWKQAERDVRFAENARGGRFFEWACFAAQQAAEKAVKALATSLGGEAWGHSVTVLLSSLPEEIGVDGPLLDAARALDRHYIQPRYPNGFDTGAPGDYYTDGDALTAIAHAEEILAFCRHRLR